MLPHSFECKKNYLRIIFTTKCENSYWYWQDCDGIYSNAHKLLCVLAAICHSTTFRHKVYGINSSSSWTSRSSSGNGDSGGGYFVVYRIYRHISHI